MIRRPIDPRFNEPVLTGRKTTTIRRQPWPEGAPIMLYNWIGKPYMSKQTPVAVVEVTGFALICITHKPNGKMEYDTGRNFGHPLHRLEGFPSSAEMDEWFRKVVKKGET